MYDTEIVHKVHDDLVGEIYRLQGEVATLNAKVAELTSTNSAIVPCPVHSTAECACKIGLTKVCKESPCMLLAQHK